MPKVSNYKIELIKKQTNIVEVIAEFLKLEKRGRNFWTVCPFHQDGNPSMSISPERQIYHCFSCSAGGNVFTFLQEYKHISFLAAVKELGHKYHIDLSELGDEENETDPELIHKTRIFEINQISLDYFINNLYANQTEPIQRYLQDRGLMEPIIEKFNIGYANNDGAELINLLLKKGYEISELENAGLILKTRNWELIFKNRLIFPIHNHDNQVVGFSGRILNANLNKQQPKYINTAETIVFKKQEVLYNVNRSANLIRKLNQVLILEGYMDIIALNKIGIENTVALMGTNLSTFHIKQLRRLTDQVYLFLDGDQPGINAMLKISIKLLMAGFIVKIINNDTIDDPDELIKHGQGQKVKLMIKNAIHPILFLIRVSEKNDLNDAVYLQKFIQQAIELLSAIGNEVERNVYIASISEFLKISPDIIKNQLKNKPSVSEQLIEEDNLNHEDKESDAKIPIVNQKHWNCEEQLIWLMIGSRLAANFVDQNIGELHFQVFRQLSRLIIGYYRDHPEIERLNLPLFNELTNDPQLLSILYKITQEVIIGNKFNKKLLQQYSFAIERFELLQDINILKNRQLIATSYEEKINLGKTIINLQKKINGKWGH